MVDLRISVVIPTYNGFERLQTTIQSVLDQSTPAHEIIVVDDGSPDATPEIAAIYGDRIRYVRTANGGQQRARNHGVSISTGNWVAPLDHDDLWDPGYLAEVTALVGAHDVDVTMANCRMWDETAGGSGSWKNRSRFTDFTPQGYWEHMGASPADRWSIIERYDYASYLAFHPSQPSLFTIRRSLYEQLGGYDERMRGSGAENLEFEIRALRVARVGLIWEPLVKILRHTANLSLDGNEMAMDVIGALDFALAHHGLDPEERRIVEAERQRRLPSALYGAFALGEYDAVLDYQRAYRGQLSAKAKLKGAIARLPRPIARAIAAVLGA